MSYSALYRKLRPTRFSDVVGQDHIVRTLGNQLKSGRISHAYMFCGTRGTGKTTTARLFARAINCENPEDGDACGKCSFCMLPEEDLTTVVFEIDAASNNKVENIRDISDEIGYLAPYGKYKVYVIDEVHMLSNSAFNALLKTLEEPPPHAVFIFASTEPQKIPVTIHSRCQRFDFKRISSEEIAVTIKGYMEAEEVSISEAALRYIARAADGSMRDALSILDQCISFYYKEDIDLAKVVELLGATDSGVLFKLADSLFARDTAECMTIIETAVDFGRDLLYMAEELTEHFRDILLVKAVGDGADVSPERANELKRQSKLLDLGSVMAYVNSFSELHQKMKYSTNQRILLELECIKLCNTLSAGKPVDVLLRLDALEHRVSSAPPPAMVRERAQPKQEPAVPPVIKKAVPSDINEIIKDWKRLVAGIGDAVLKAMLMKVKPGFIEGDLLYIVCPNPGIMDYLKLKQGEIKNHISKGKLELSMSLILQEDYDKKHKSKFDVEDDPDSGMDMLSKIFDK